jgi:hypothetical protein
MRLHFAVAECYSFGRRRDEKFNFAAVRSRNANGPRRHCVLFVILNQQFASIGVTNTKVSCGAARKCTPPLAGEYMRLIRSKGLLTYRVTTR